MNKVSSAYDKIAKKFSETRHSAWGEFNEFSDYLKPNSDVLDLGCGNGRLYSYLRSSGFVNNYLGLDFSKELLKFAKQKFPLAKFKYADMRDLQIQKKFDAIFLIASFHHLEKKSERQLLLKKLKNLLKKDGKIFLTNWNLYQKKYQKYLKKAYWQSWTFLSSKKDCYIPFKDKDNVVMRYYYAFDKEELDKLVVQSGFEIIDSFYYQKTMKTTDVSEAHNLCHILKSK